MNVFTFSGNLGRDAERRTTQNGKNLLNFSVPVKSGFGDHEKTDWIRCTLWGRQADSRLVECLLKGTSVVVTGEASLNTYTKRDGETSASINCNVRDISLCGKKPDTQRVNNAPDYPRQTEPVLQSNEDLDQEIPF